MNWAYIFGTLLGAIIGSMLIGGLLGWAVFRISRGRVAIEHADAFALLLLAIGAGFTNSGIGGIPAIVVYGCASLVAYFGLRKIRNNQPAVPAAAPVTPRDWRPLRRIIGGVLLTVLGAVGLTFLFSAFRQVVSPTLYGGSPEFSFLVGAVLIIPCVFIWRGMIR